MRLFATLALLLVLSPALAQTPGTCAPGTAEADLDIADVQARLFNAGNLFFGNDTYTGDGYIVPKATASLPRPHSPIFAAGIWIGGLVGGDLRAAGSTYQNFEFWPGPLGEDGSLPDPDDCSAFDRIWVVDAFDLQTYEDTGVATDDMAAWPVELGAPVIDGDGIEGNYNLEGGDRPAVYGHQTAFWVMNDLGNTHQRFDTEPIGLEVRVTAFVSAEGLLDRHTFYRYELVNRNSLPFEDAHFGLFVDSDLGDASDDRVGSDSTRNMAFVYNAEATDSVYGIPPAAGYDLLSGAGSSMYLQGPSQTPYSDPITAGALYNRLQGLWNDGLPVTEGGNGYATGGDIVTWTYPGDPVTEQFWSEVNVDGNGTDEPAGDRRHLIASPAFTLAPGESRSFDLAILFAQGTDRFDSVTRLREASDAVQFRYDGGTLFAPGFEPPPPGGLATPALLTPENGTVFIDEPAPLAWADVPGAESYRVEVALAPDFSDREAFNTTEPALSFTGASNAVLDYHWRVKAVAGGLVTSHYSEARSFRFYRYESDDFGGGVGIVETAHPGVDDVCADDPDDPGCAAGYGGNTVWLDPNATGDYLITTPSNQFLGPAGLFHHVQVAVPDDFELRFTEACATFGACLGVYASALPGGNDLVVSVPFELWNVGRQAEDVPEDDVRMIPMLRALEGTVPSADWADAFPATQEVRVGADTLTLGVTQRVSWVMPDRPDGYALFEAAADGFGGPGSVYDPEQDGDTQVDLNPATGYPCTRQRYYADFCYEGASPHFVAPIGGTAGMLLADLAGNGTTPPAGTVVRFDSNDVLEVDAEDEVPSQPSTFAIGAVYPNPFARSATVPFEVERAGSVRLSVFDVLGRRVAVLAEGEVAAGAHRATFDGSRLASGVYLVVLEAEGRRQTQKVLLVR